MLVVGMGEDANLHPPLVALVTGAGSGIGRAIAMQLARQGVHVLALGRSIEPLRQLDVEASRASGADHVTPVPCDLCDLPQLERVAQSIRVWPGRLDMLIHCAGDIRFGGIDSVTAADAQVLWQTHCLGPMVLSQELLSLLRSSTGQIAFINSSIATATTSNRLAYATSKAAAKSLADSIRNSVSHDGIRVVSFFLGRVDTPMQGRVLEYEDRLLSPEQMMPPMDVARAVVEALNLPRTVQLTDVHLRQPKA
jgi:NAD(P)-dependent dehydrogenase (short-subunit alcohol dehydrogenase family)